MVRVNLKTGQRAQPGDDKVILEAFSPAPSQWPEPGIMGVGVARLGLGRHANTGVDSSGAVLTREPIRRRLLTILDVALYNPRRSVEGVGQCAQKPKRWWWGFVPR